MGISFTAALLAVVHPMAREPADVADDLGALTAARFVRPDDGAPDAWSWCQVRLLRGSCWHSKTKQRRSRCARSEEPDQRSSIASALEPMCSLKQCHPL